MKSDSRKEFGDYGENTVSDKYLKDGYLLEQKNFREKTGEIDLIFRKDRFLVFTEVKSRISKEGFIPEKAVNLFKRRKIIKTAQLYCIRNKIRTDELIIRFDIAVLEKNNGFETVRIYENAFDSYAKII